ncbi:MAG: hypothetical protein PUC23_00765 [bacterium]|nr:hypothetical protein [bacterium]
MSIAKEQNNSNINNVNNVSQETIDKYENAKETIDRKTLLEVADTLEIYFKKGAIVTIDENMSKRAGNNKTPKIIDVSSFDKTGNLEILTREVNDLAKEMYSNNQNRYTLVENIDTNTNFELGNLGIDKTFSKNVPFEKLPTYNKLKEIGEQGLYYKTSYDANKKDGIKYHHFLTPVKAINTEGNAFIRTVVKEYTKDIGQNNKFYYHQIEYLDNRKGITDTSHIGNRTFGNPLTDNIITNNNENVKLPTAISNNNMQNNENNTIKSSKTSNPLEISKLTKEDANTTPLLPKRTYQKGDGESSFYSNITEKSKFLNEDLRKMMKDEENIEYYKEITNKDTLEKAYEKLQEGGMEETAKWFNKDVEKGNISAVDVTEGWILLKQYQDAGDYLSAVEVAKRMRDIGTKAGQTVQAFNIMNRLTPEGMVYYAQSELSEAYNKMVKNKTKKWIDQNINKFDLNPNEVKFIMDTMNEVKDMQKVFIWTILKNKISN